MGHEAGVNVDPEPYGLFSAHIPAAALQEGGHLHFNRERQGLVPDLLVNFPNNHGPGSTFLAEIKSLSAGKTWYRSSRKTVDVRASKLSKEYLDKARHIDQNYNNTTADQSGPVQLRLESFGDLQGLVIGQFCEGSQDLHNLLAVFADEKAANLSRSKGVPVSKHQHSLILQQFRRRFSVTAVNAQSACLLTRLGHMGEGARQAAQRRALCLRQDEASRQDLRAHFDAHIRGRRLHRAGLLHI